MSDPQDFPRNMSRRLSDNARIDECDIGQHVLYQFLMDVHELSKRVGKLEENGEKSDRAQRKIREEFEAAQKKLDAQAKVTEEACRLIKEVLQRLKKHEETTAPLVQFMKKAKNGVLVLLAVYFLKDSPELLKLVLGLLGPAK